MMVTYTTILGLAGLVYFVLWPVFEYFRDPKGLRRYPNMTLFSGISSIPFMLMSARGFRSRELQTLHTKHPILRTGPNALSYGDVRAIRDIYGHNTRCTKDASYLVTAGSHFHLADVIDKPEHARKRKVLSSAYALKNLESWEHKVTDKLVRLVRHFDGVCTSPPPPPLSSGRGVVEDREVDEKELTLDFRAWTNFFTLDAIADIGLSETLGFLDTGSDVVIAERKDGSTYETTLCDALYPTARKQALLVRDYAWYPILNRVVNIIPFFAWMQESARRWEDIVWRRAMQRRRRYERGEELDDFFAALMEDKGSASSGSGSGKRGRGLEWGEVVAEINIMNAGSVTTAIAITNVVYQLLKNPGCLARLREEVDSVFEGSSEEEVIAPYDKVKHLPYLRACLDESLRIFPPTSHGLPRQTPAEGMDILGQWVPGNTTVSVSAFVAHGDEGVYPEADKYRPERWLGEEGKALQPYFLAFSAGARSCIGRNISYLEQTKVLATLVRRYEFALPSEEWELGRLETMNLILGGCR